MKKEMKREPARSNCLTYKNLLQSIPASIRFVSGRDFRQITAIERDSFEHPWSKRDLHSKLCEDHVVCYVVEHEGCIVAYAIIQYYKDHIELCNLAVDSHYRRRKIASLIINMLKIKAYLENKEYIAAYVSEYNLGAQLFLSSKGNGFLAEEVLRDFYCDGHSAYYMEFNLV
jgi:ribosomal protein S18 acetylase RimI-like enzyme